MSTWSRSTLERRMKKMKKIYAEMDQKVSDLRQKYDADRVLFQARKAMLEYNEKSSTTLLNSQQRWQDEIASTIRCCERRRIY